MKVDLKVIQNYILILTESTVAATGDPMKDLSDFDEALETMVNAARENDEEDLLRIVLDTITTDINYDLDAFRGQYYGWSDEELIELFNYAFVHLWPDFIHSLPGQEVKVDFI